MSTLVSKLAKTEKLGATGVRFTDSTVYISLSDQREIGLPLSHPGLRWLAKATREQRARWSIAPGGWSVLWDELDDGIEVEHLLKNQPL